MNTRRALLLVATLLGTLLLSSTAWGLHVDDGDDDQSENEGAPHQLVVFAVDSLMGKHGTSRLMPHTQMFASEGVFSPRMRTIGDTRASRPGWASIFFSASPELLGCDAAGCMAMPAIRADMASWVSILEEEHDYDVSIFTEELDEDTMGDLFEREVRHFKPMSEGMFDYLQDGDYHTRASMSPRRVIIIHFTGLDRIGQVSGYDAVNYRAKIQCLDEQIAILTRYFWAKQPRSSTFMLVSNRGGSQFDHEQFNLDGIQVPFMMWGYGVKRKAPIFAEYYVTQQIGPTVLLMLGYEDDIPEYWFNKPMLTMLPDEDEREDYHYLDFEEIEGRKPDEKLLEEWDPDVCRSIPYTTRHDIVRQANALLFFVFIFIMIGMSLVISHLRPR